MSDSKKNKHCEKKHHKKCCKCYKCCKRGPAGTNGIDGTNGTNGINGTNAIVSLADFFALMPGDNSATVAIGADVDFPQDGAQIGGEITRSNASTFILG